MDINWRAVGYGFVVSAVLGMVSGFSIPMLGVSLPEISYVILGLFGGFTAGYLASTDIGSGALHGAIATLIGGLIVAALLVLVGTVTFGLSWLFGGIIGIAIALPVAAIPGALGGAVGSYVKGFGERRAMGKKEPAA